MNIQLTRDQAFMTIKKFLFNYYCNQLPEEIATLVRDWPQEKEKKSESPAWKKWIIILPNELSLTSLEAYKAMQLLLEGYFYSTSSDDLGGLLSSLQLFPDGGTWDPAAWIDWSNSVNEILNEK